MPVIPPIDLSAWKITPAQAIAAASTYVPSDILNLATIMADMEMGGNLKSGETYYYWSVVFMNISVTDTELGWQSDRRTTLNSGTDGTYNEIIIRINAVNGDYVSRTAYYAVKLGGTV